MKNFEYWEKEVKEIIRYGEDVAIVDDKPVECCGCDCNDCQLYNSNDGNCTFNVLNWLYEEHIDKPKINKRTKSFFDSIETGWVARESNGELWIYTIYPIKCEYGWEPSEDDYCRFTKLDYYDFLTLDFIKWSDEKPWSVKDIRNLKVEE